MCTISIEPLAAIVFTGHTIQQVSESDPTGLTDYAASSLTSLLDICPAYQSSGESSGFALDRFVRQLQDEGCAIAPGLLEFAEGAFVEVSLTGMKYMEQEDTGQLHIYAGLPPTTTVSSFHVQGLQHLLNATA